MNFTDLPLELTQFVFNQAENYPSWTLIYSLLSFNNRVHRHPVHETAQSGELKLLKWLINLGFKFNHETYFAAGRGNQIEVIDYLDSYHRQAFIGAAESGHYDFFLHFGYHPFVPDSTAARAAAEAGHLEVLQYIDAGPHRCQVGMMEAAAKGGHQKIVEWLYNEKFPWEQAAVFAVMEGHFELLKWMMGHGCPQSPLIYVGAAEGGHLQILIWLHQSGYIADIYNCMAGALINGHLEVAKWLFSQGCPLHEAAIENAVTKGYLKIFIWLLEKFPNISPSEYLDRATQLDHRDIVIWIKDQLI